jgi:hypothetical protein
MVHTNPGRASTGKRPWYQPCPHKAGLADMNARVEVMEASTYIIKERLGSQLVCNRVRVPENNLQQGNV